MLRIYFRFDDSEVLSDYLDNAAALSALDSIIAGGSTSLKVTTYSSPEGNLEYNKALSAKRAGAMAKWLREKYPSLEGKIVENPDGEAWQALRDAVQDDPRIPERTREKMLAIIDSDADPDRKEAELKAMPVFGSLYATHFRRLRFAALSFEGLAEAHSASYAWMHGDRVIYRLNSATIDPAYMDNGATLEQIRIALGKVDSDRIESILISSASSPEGPLAVNHSLALRRGKALFELVAKEFPQLAGKITVTSTPESWDVLREAVVSDGQIGSEVREAILKVIDADVAEDVREARLKALPSYGYLYREHFPKIRYASLNVKYAEEPQPEAEPEPTIEPETEPEPVQEVVPLPEPEPEPKPEPTPELTLPKPEREWKTIIALKTNLLYDAVSALNFEVEVPFAGRWSLMAEDVFPWWETGNKYCFQMWEMGLEGRYWLRPWDTQGTEKLRGWFGGVYLMSSKYDFQYKEKLNYQGEYWSAGVSLGYSKPVAKWANLEFSLGLGYLHSGYRHYLPADDYSMLLRDRSKDGKLSYFGPTKAKVSLVVPINVPRKKEAVR